MIAPVVIVCALGAAGTYFATRPVEAPEMVVLPPFPVTPPPSTTPGVGGVVAPPAPAVTETPLQPRTEGSIRPTAADIKIADDLTMWIDTRGPVSPEHIASAESLYVRYPADPRFGRILEHLFLLAARQAGPGNRDRAIEYARRAVAVKTGNHDAPIALIRLLVAAEDWPAVETAAREALEGFPRSAEALLALGRALYRQDRNREAAEALRASLEVQDNGEARQILARIEKGLVDERGMTQQQLAHFHVRYDGGEHEGVGREILRALERHYATLTSTLDHQPASTIPVILFSREGYYNANGAPAWSGGNYDTMDGRIRIPIGGLTESLTPDMDETLIHELTHAFAMDLSRNVIPRDVNEGLAQFLEGKRVASVLPPEQLTALANGRAGGVYGFYMESLAFAEYLMGLRGQGGMNDLLRDMGRTGDVDAAFRNVHGQDYAATKKAFRDRFRQQHGS